MVIYFGASAVLLIFKKGKVVPTRLLPSDSDEKPIFWCFCKNSVNHKRWRTVVGSYLSLVEIKVQ